MVRTTLPKKIYARMDMDEGYILAYDNLTDAIEDDGPTLIFEYEFVKATKIKKIAAKA